MNIVYAMDSILTEYFGSTSIENTSSFLSEGEYSFNGNSSIENESSFLSAGKNLYIGNISIENESEVTSSGQYIGIYTGALITSTNNLFVADGESNIYLGNISILNTSSIDIGIHSASVNIISTSFLSYNIIDGKLEIISSQGINIDSTIIYNASFFLINNSSFNSSSNFVVRGQISILSDENKVVTYGILSDEPSPILSTESNLICDSRVGYYNYGSIDILNESICDFYINILDSGSSQILNNQILNINGQIEYNGKSNINSEELILIEGNYINDSIYGLCSIENESYVESSGFGYDVGQFSISNDSLILVDGNIGLQEYGFATLNSISSIEANSIIHWVEYGNLLIENESIIYCNGIIPIRQNIVCGIIDIIILDDITIIDKTVRKNIITNKAIEIKNC